MASVPLIEPTAVGGLPPAPHLDPGSYAELSTRGLRAVTGAAGTVAQVAADIHHIQQTLTTEQDKLAAEQALNQYRLDGAQNQMDLKQDLSVSGKDYAAKVEDYNRKNRENIGKTLKSQGARLRFERGVDDLQTTAAINARAEGLQMQVASIKAGTDEVLQSYERAEIFARDPADQAYWAEKREGRIALLEGKRIYTPAEASARRIGGAERVAKGRLQVEWQDPTKRPVILAQLAAGEVVGIPAGEQLELRRTLQSQQHVDEEREYTKDKRAQLERATTAEKTITDAWRSGDLAKAKQLLGEAWRDLSADDYAKLDERIQQPPRPPALENDRATMLALQPEVYSVTNDPRKVLPLVHQALHDGKINDGTHRVLANELQNRILGEDQRRERAQDRAAARGEASLAERKFVYTQGKDLIEETFKTTGMFEKFDTIAQDAKTAALGDYYANTNPYNPKMSTQQWVATRLPEYRAQVTTKTATRFNEINRALVQANIPVSGDLKAPQTAGAVRSFLQANKGELIKKHGPEGFYDLAQQVREAEIMATEMARIQAFGARGGGGGGGTAPAPSAPAQGQPGSASQPFQKREKSGGR